MKLTELLECETMSPIDFSLFDWKEIFGTVKATDGLKRPQARGLRTEIQEISTAKHSAGQFTYVGMRENGKDYYSSNGCAWEDKSTVGMFKGKTKTMQFILKNFQGNNTGEIQKTFDYILLKDTGSMSVAWATWDAVRKNVIVTDAIIKSHVEYYDLHFIETNVIPNDKGDFAKAIEKLIEELV